MPWDDSSFFRIGSHFSGSSSKKHIPSGKHSHSNLNPPIPIVKGIYTWLNFQPAMLVYRSVTRTTHCKLFQVIIRLDTPCRKKPMQKSPILVFDRPLGRHEPLKNHQPKKRLRSMSWLPMRTYSFSVDYTTNSDTTVHTWDWDVGQTLYIECT